MAHPSITHSDFTFYLIVPDICGEMEPEAADFALNLPPVLFPENAAMRSFAAFRTEF
jgi:hypothetical protein